jgi:hypothetical protein
MSHARIRELEALNRTSFVSLALQLSSVTIERLRAGVEDFQKERFRELQVKAQQKLLLLSNVSRKTTTSTPREWVVNLSKQKLTEAQTSVLSKGLNFSVVSRKLPTREIVFGVEDGIQNLTQKEKDEIRGKVVQHLSRPARHIPDNITSDERKALTELSTNDDIQVLPADKGRMTVVMDKVEYIERVNNILKDETRYKVLKRDPTASIERLMNKKLKTLESALGRNLYLHLRSTDGITPECYGLVKVHKDNYPLRPIVSYVDAPTYNLAKWIAGILKVFEAKSERQLKNSYQFVEEIRTLELPDDHTIVSFDVVNMFPSIPLDFTIDTIKKGSTMTQPSCHVVQLVRVTFLCWSNS